MYNEYDFSKALAEFTTYLITSNELKWVDIEPYGHIYYYDVPQCRHNRRRVYLLKRFAVCSCEARYGYDRANNYKYRADMSEEVDISECDIHHEIDGRIYAIPREIHRRISHIGMCKLLTERDLQLNIPDRKRPTKRFRFED